MTHRRPLTSGEIALVRALFGDAVDPLRAQVSAVRWAFFQPERVVMAPMGTIHFHPAGGLYRDDFAAADVDAQALFLHEMTHVWQTQTRGQWYLVLMRHPFCRYDYQLVPGRPFARYGLEQQAEIVRHVFLYRHGRQPANAPPHAALEALLPF